jgi:hypothetical protein
MALSFVHNPREVDWASNLGNEKEHVTNNASFEAVDRANELLGARRALVARYELGPELPLSLSSAQEQWQKTLSRNKVAVASFMHSCAFHHSARIHPTVEGGLSNGHVCTSRTITSQVLGGSIARARAPIPTSDSD